MCVSILYRHDITQDEVFNCSFNRNQIIDLELKQKTFFSCSYQF